jgi:predicted nucleic acid-binding protein
MNNLVLCDTNIFIEIFKKNEFIRSELNTKDFRCIPNLKLYQI